jgi:hypothetical protein
MFVTLRQAFVSSMPERGPDPLSVSAGISQCPLRSESVLNSRFFLQCHESVNGTSRQFAATQLFGRGNGCSFYVFETGEQIERCSYFFIVS